MEVGGREVGGSLVGGSRLIKDLNTEPALWADYYCQKRKTDFERINISKMLKTKTTSNGQAGQPNGKQKTKQM